ncbi:striatin-interacting protein 1 isoform X3 [Apis cerana]|uniref:Striatin-interacting protein 1 isoform X2 n=1 Tax=Apis mellifera TaxID=7460 RepID=A0A7M7GWM6_APIME|nr:striatin-interacting protein 1 isoform X2 [Apis mellifera]XP_028522052.1 striatin-interacting protein 1 isoform X3 [Apis cerana]|eukprot:XP_006564789.1 striatin-interacting protein 1 isoform X2 [Apis mellifera]
MRDVAMDANGNGKRDLPRIVLQQRIMSTEETSKSTDLDFIYDDADKHANEIAELYSYSEQSELHVNLTAFEEQMELYKLRPWWQNLSEAQQKSVIYKLLDQLEVSNKQLRMKAARCILYLAQGCWAEVQSDEEQREWTRKNVMLLYEAGIFPTFVELLNIEITNSRRAASAMRKISVSLDDSTDLRVILSVLYIITEVMREEMKNLKHSIYKNNVESFKEDLINPYGEELLIVKLLGMVTYFCSGAAPHFPMKKVLLLLWKLILVSLGGIDTLRELKKQYREEAGLDTQQEDTLEVAKTMRASSPPVSAADLIETQNQKKNHRSYRRFLMKQSSLDEPGLEMEYEGAEMGNDTANNEGEGEANVFMNQTVLTQLRTYCQNENNQPQVRPDTPQLTKGKSLPWTPKVRQKDVDTFLEVSRLKFVGYNLEGDRQSLAGLPQPILEGVNTLKRHMYISLAEIQIQKEEQMLRNPISTPRFPIRQTPTEIVYHAILPFVPQYMIALLKILLAAAPTSKAKTDSTNIMADVLPGQMPIPILDFPMCVIGEQPDVSLDNLETGDNSPCSWRNVFSCINLLRILNKLTKWKHSRIMMLIVFKSAPILKRTLKVRHAMMQLYVLKLLKMQTRYLGRQWRKTNMKTISAIYAKVRHRLNDDWAYGNDLEARPWDFQVDECVLRSCVDRFNNLRYTNVPKDKDMEPVDNSVTSVLGVNVELSDEFKQHYELWLQQEVFQRSINWDELLDPEACEI